MIAPDKISFKMRFRWLFQSFRKPVEIFSTTGTPLSVKSSVSERIVHPRNGTYLIGIRIMDVLPTSAYSYDFGARIKITLKGKKKEIVTVVGDKLSPYFAGKGNNGFTLLGYEVPEEVDLDVNLKIEVFEAATSCFYSQSSCKWWLSTDTRV